MQSSSLFYLTTLIQPPLNRKKINKETKTNKKWKITQNFDTEAKLFCRGFSSDIPCFIKMISYHRQIFLSNYILKSVIAKNLDVYCLRIYCLYLRKVSGEELLLIDNIIVT